MDDNSGPSLDRAALVVNTASRRGAEAYERVRKRLLDLGIPLTECYPIIDASRLAEVVDHLVEDGYRLVVVGGGDGTISSVVGALRGSGTVLGVLPLGTANDLARTLDIPADLDAACAVIADGQVVDIDVGRVGSTSFLNVASIGLSVEVTRGLSPPSSGDWARWPIRSPRSPPTCGTGRSGPNSASPPVTTHRSSSRTSCNWASATAASTAGATPSLPAPASTTTASTSTPSRTDAFEIT